MAEIETVRVTYREISERFGIGLEGARIKAKRRAAKGLWRIIPGNHPQDVIRVEMPAEEFDAAVSVGRGAGNTPNDIPPTLPAQPKTQQEGERREGNDLEALVQLLSETSERAAAMAERLIVAEKGKSDAEMQAAILRVGLDSAEQRMAEAQDRHVADLREMQARLEAEATRARDQLTTYRSLPWWKRLAG